MYEMSSRPRDRSERTRQRVEEKMSRGQARIDQAQERLERAQERMERERERMEQALIWLREEPSSRRPSHTRADIARAALAIADEEGYEALSMRRVAERLGSGTMTLYHYVRNKDELITLMTDEVMGEVLVPAGEMGEDWRTAMGQIARRTRAAFHRHRWALDRLGDGRPGPNGIRHFEQSLEAVSPLDVSDGEKFELVSLVDDYVFGFCLREAQEMEEHRRGFSSDVLEFFQRELDSGGYPNIRDFLGDDVEAGVDRIADLLFDEDRFERGLERLLDGIEAGLAAAGKRRRPKRPSR
jgi:AcrR family transcriptional regulator